jgi:hypothetical protein
MARTLRISRFTRRNVGLFYDRGTGTDENS